MDLIVSNLAELLPEYGPWLLFAFAVLETSFVTGFAIPSGVATSVATVLALEGQMRFVPVVAAATAGGALGDSIGFWIGRWMGDRILHGEGRWAKKVASRSKVTRRFFGRHPAVSVATARLVSFVRTLMPMAAGISGMTYRRYLRYELIGLAGWISMYVGLGFAAQGSWEAASRPVGAGGTLALLALAAGVWIALRRRRTQAENGPVAVERSVVPTEPPEALET